jgi:hypothetical protein
MPMKLLNPLLYTLALMSMTFASCKHRNKSLLSDAGSPVFWQKEIMQNNDNDSSHVHLSGNEKRHLCLELNGTHLDLTRHEIDKSTTPESEVVWGYLVKNKGNMVGDTIAKVSNTMLAVGKAHSDIYTKTHTSIIRFRHAAHEKSFFFDHVTINTFNKDQVIKTKNNFLNDTF